VLRYLLVVQQWLVTATQVVGKVPLLPCLQAVHPIWIESEFEKATLLA
jgi:hypothetical protein